MGCQKLQKNVHIIDMGRERHIVNKSNIAVLKECERLDIRFALLPPNTTDKTQPLDVAFFRPLKVHWRKIMEKYKLKFPYATGLNKSHFPGLLKQLMTCKELNEKKVLQSGFRACGIWPVNRNEVMKKLPKPQNNDEPEDEVQVATVHRGVSDAVLELLQKFKYNPKMVNGKAVEVKGVRNIIRFELDKSSQR